MAVDNTNNAAVNQTANTQPPVNPADLIEVRGMTVDEALEQYKNMSGGQALLRQIEIDRAAGREDSARRTEQQMLSTAQSIARNNSVAVDRETGAVIDSVSNSWADRPNIGGAERYLKNKNGPRLAIDKEISRILSDSNTVNEQGKKVAETPDQQAALTNLAVRLKQFGDVVTANKKTITDILQQAMPNASRSELFKITIQKPIAFNQRTKQAYTTYGSGLSIQMPTQPNVDPIPNIVSPEGVRLNNFNFTPIQMLEYGLSKEAVINGINLMEQSGLTLNNQARDLRAILQSTTGGTDFSRAMQERNRLTLQRDAALDTFLQQSGPFITRRAEQEARQEFIRTSPEQKALESFNLEGFAGSGVTELTPLPEGAIDISGGFGAISVPENLQFDRTGNFFDEEGILISSRQEAIRNTTQTSLYPFLNLVATTSNPEEQTQYTLPSWSLDSYVQQLNNIYKTPNNNIVIGSGGLEYRFADGSSVSWGTNIDRLNTIPAMYGFQPAGGRQGEIFSNAQQFNSAEEYQTWKRSTASGSTAVSAPRAPTVAEPEVEEATVPGMTDFQPTAPVQPPVYGQQQPITQQPITPPFQTISTPTGIQTPTGLTGTTFPQTQTSGTFQVPSITAGFGAVPSSVGTTTGVAGFTPTQLSATVPGFQDPNTVGVRTVNYTNQMGQTIPVTESNGQPITYVPPGFSRTAGAAEGGLMVKGYQEGGSVDDNELDAMYRMATRFLGYRGPKSRTALENFAKSSPAAATKMRAYTSAMAKGGMVKGYQEGGSVSQDELSGMSGNLMRQTLQPMQAPVEMMQPTEMDFIPTTAGQAAPVAPMAQVATVPQITQANMPNVITPASFQAQTVTPQIQEAMQQLQPAQMQLAPQAQVQAAQQQGTSVSGIEAAQGTAIMMDNPMQREIQQGELISGTSVDATKIEELNNQIQAAQATPTKQATIQGQLEGLMAQFEGGATPAWAAGAMRNAMATLSARGLGASSLAGQAVVQAAMESAMPIAQIDAQTRAQFEAQNLSNRQQTAMMAAQQRATFLQMEFDQEFQSRVQNASRIADIANMNFTAEQQVALENSRMANTTNLQNLTNRQAKVMAEAAALANMDMANLNNRQQAAVQNAQNFLQVDLTNLNNEQQTALFKSQQNAQALFTDQAAQNAAQQFNAASENQTNQFFASLATQVSQFNATQQNAMEQFNVNSTNAMRQFNSEVQQQRDLFNAQNGLVIAQANAQWRQNIATLNTAAQNQSNMEFARTINALTSTNLDQIWQRERDIMNYAFTQSETSLDRALSILLADKELDAYREKMAADQRDARAAFGTSVLLEWMRS